MACRGERRVLPLDAFLEALHYKLLDVLLELFDRVFHHCAPRETVVNWDETQ